MRESPYIVRVSQGVRECVLGGRSLGQMTATDLRQAYLILSAYATDVAAELTKRGEHP